MTIEERLAALEAENTELRKLAEVLRECVDHITAHREQLNLIANFTQVTTEVLASHKAQLARLSGNPPKHGRQSLN